MDSFSLGKFFVLNVYLIGFLCLVSVTLKIYILIVMQIKTVIIITDCVDTGNMHQWRAYSQSRSMAEELGTW